MALAGRCGVQRRTAKIIRRINIGAVLAMIGFAAAVCNMTPAGQSTVNTVAIGSGYTDTKTMFFIGLITAIIAFIVLVFLAYPLASALMPY